MAKREKFGKFVLLEEIDSTSLGHEYRAAKLSSTGLEKIVNVLRLKPSLSTQADAVKNLMDQVKLAAQLQNPNVLKIYGIGKVEGTYYISYEFLEGKSLKAIFNRCRQEGFPFSIDHALLIASKTCSALEYAHSRKSDNGQRYFHGLVTPGCVLVSYEGEVRVRGFGYWPSRIRQTGGIAPDEAAYLAPEQSGSGMGDHRSDVFAVGALLFESLTGEPLSREGRNDDAAQRLSQARLQNPTTEDDALPKPVAEILSRALHRDPSSRYAEIQEMRKAVDTLLFSGDFTPTTFNLAFFMHSLFREDIEREAKALKEEREASYLEYLTETAPPVKAPAPPPEPPPVVHMPSAHASETHTPRPSPPPALHTPPPLHREPTHRDHTPPPAFGHDSSTEPLALPTVTAKEAAAGFTFHKDGGAKSKMPLIGGGVLALLVLGGLGYYLVAGRKPAEPTPPPTTTLSPEALAALEKVRELEERLKTMEAEKAAAEQQAAEEAKKKMEAQAKAKGQAVDPAAVQRAQEDAARKARQEQERRQQEEQRRIEEEKRAEEARLAEERRRAEEEAARVAAAAAVTTTTLAPVTTTLAPVRAGTLVSINDPGVIPPIAVTNPPLTYPPIALRQRVEGTVDVNALIDEKGNVTDAQVISGSGGKAGLNEAAIENVKRRRYRPATKDGVPVKVWSPVKVVFRLPS